MKCKETVFGSRDYYPLPEALFNVPSSIHLGNQDKKLPQMNISRRNCCLPAMDKEFTLGILLHRPCYMTIIHEEVKRMWCSKFRPRSELKLYYLVIFSWLWINKNIKIIRLSESSVKKCKSTKVPETYLFVGEQECSNGVMRIRFLRLQLNGKDSLIHGRIVWPVLFWFFLSMMNKSNNNWMVVEVLLFWK